MDQLVVTGPRPRHPVLRYALATCAVALLATGCRSTPDSGFPDPASASMEEGIFANLENARQVSPGLTKRQLYALLGTPHFNEGMWGVRQWNYLINFRRDAGQAYYRCQLRIDFDSDGIASATQWHPESCRTLLDPPPPPEPEPAPAAPAPLPPEPLRLSGDALFGFDSAELTAQGRASLDPLVAQIRDASQVQEIMVTGHADRIGSEAYNLELSIQRAAAVRDYLIANGVPADAVTSQGRGSSESLSQCDGQRGQALVDCLAPDRRVEISGRAL